MSVFSPNYDQIMAKKRFALTQSQKVSYPRPKKQLTVKSMIAHHNFNVGASKFRFIGPATLNRPTSAIIYAPSIGSASSSGDDSVIPSGPPPSDSEPSLEPSAAAAAAPAEPSVKTESVKEEKPSEPPSEPEPPKEPTEKGKKDATDTKRGGTGGIPVVGTVTSLKSIGGSAAAPPASPKSGTAGDEGKDKDVLDSEVSETEVDEDRAETERQERAREKKEKAKEEKAKKTAGVEAKKKDKPPEESDEVKKKTKEYANIKGEAQNVLLKGDSFEKTWTQGNPKSFAVFDVDGKLEETFSTITKLKEARAGWFRKARDISKFGILTPVAADKQLVLISKGTLTALKPLAPAKPAKKAAEAAAPPSPPEKKADEEPEEPEASGVLAKLVSLLSPKKTTKKKGPPKTK